ncbi:hypothetical protein BLNAU_13460 [Blattamonas nauphoetae]|uniref:Uncharacterized protein n=1 Tax=Blattamonas nauphoetae TaxID=2049346 RepID=A0ABQ9XGJ2_9EUKA|nr:hypothetical protein BLNAU_13460 [Blattamonas nauphoetae]
MSRIPIKSFKPKKPVTDWDSEEGQRKLAEMRAALRKNIPVSKPKARKPAVTKNGVTKVEIKRNTQPMKHYEQESLDSYVKLLAKPALPPSSKKPSQGPKVSTSQLYDLDSLLAANSRTEKAKAAPREPVQPPKKHGFVRPDVRLSNQQKERFRDTMKKSKPALPDSITRVPRSQDLFGTAPSSTILTTTPLRPPQAHPKPVHRRPIEESEEDSNFDDVDDDSMDDFIDDRHYRATPPVRQPSPTLSDATLRAIFIPKRTYIDDGEAAVSSGRQIMSEERMSSILSRREETMDRLNH